MTRDKQIELAIAVSESIPDLIRELMEDNKRLRAEQAALARTVKLNSREVVAARSMDGEGAEG